MVLRGRSWAAVDDNEINLHKPLAAETAQQAATVVRLVERSCVSHGRSVREKKSNINTNWRIVLPKITTEQLDDLYSPSLAQERWDSAQAEARFEESETEQPSRTPPANEDLPF